MSSTKKIIWWDREELGRGKSLTLRRLSRKASEEVAFKWGQKNKNEPAMPKAEEEPSRGLFLVSVTE